MWGSSLSVQWLGCGAFTAVTCTQSLVGELGSSKLWDEAKQYIKLEILTWLFSRLVPEAELWAQSSLSSSGLNDSVLEIQTQRSLCLDLVFNWRQIQRFLSVPEKGNSDDFDTHFCLQASLWHKQSILRGVETSVHKLPYLVVLDFPPNPPRNALVSARRRWGADGHCLPLGRSIWVTLQTLPPAVQDWLDLDDSEQQWPSSSFCIMSGVVDGIWLGLLWEH